MISLSLGDYIRRGEIPPPGKSRQSAREDVLGLVKKDGDTWASWWSEGTFSGHDQAVGCQNPIASHLALSFVEISNLNSFVPAVWNSEGDLWIPI